MGCGCGKNKLGRKPRSVGRNIAATRSQRLTSLSVEKSASGLDKERRAIEKKRREAIRNALGI